MTNFFKKQPSLINRMTIKRGIFDIKSRQETALIVIFTLLTATSMRAQSVHGSVVDEHSAPIEYANVVVLNPLDSTFVNGCPTDSLGRFTIHLPQEPMLLRVSAIGFNTQYTLIKGDSLIKITLSGNNKTLGEVVVRGERPTVIYRGDRLIVDVRHSLLGIGNDGESLLRLLPGVWSEHGNITINGKAGATVMIDNRQVELAGEQLAAYLHGLRSENIEKIEVIANPSAEFSANGAGGVIRIITRNGERGARLYAGSGFGVVDYKSVEPYFSYSWDRNRWGGNVAFNGTVGRGLLKTDSYTDDRKNRIINDEHSDDPMTDHIANATLNLYYDFNRSNHLSWMVGWMYWAKDEHIDTRNQISGPGATAIRLSTTDHREKQDMQRINASLNYELSFGAKQKHKMLWIADAVRLYHYSTNSNYLYIDYDATRRLLNHENMRYEQPRRYTILSTELRFTLDWGKWGNAMIGTKYSHSTVDNALRNFTKSDDSHPWIRNPRVGFDFAYTEHLFATYAKYNLTQGKWTLSVGLRSEYDKAGAIGSETSYKRFDLFPNLYYTYTFNDIHSLSVSASRRTRRVPFFYLIPLRYYNSRYSLNMGNPALKPDFSQSVELIYALKEEYYLTLTYDWSNNGLSIYNRTETDGGQPVTVQTHIDGVHQRNWNLDLYIPIKIFSWWNMTNQFNGRFNHYKSATTRVHDFTYSVYTEQAFSLPRHFRLTLLYRYESKSKNAFGREEDYHLLNFAVAKNFFHDHLVCKLAADGLLWAQKPYSTFTSSEVFVSSAMYGRHLPQIKLTAYYTLTWGKTHNTRKMERSNREENGRAM